MKVTDKITITNEDNIRIKTATEEYINNKKITGYNSNIEGVGIHFKDGIIWALKNIKTN